MDKQQLYQKALATVRQRRQVAETKAVKDKNDLYEALPQLREMEQKITEAGTKAAMLSLAGQKEEAAEKLKELKVLSGQKEHLLSQVGKSEYSLKAAYHCTVCEDTGKHDGKMCDCVQEEMKKLRRSDVHSGGPLNLCRFENFSLNYYPERMEMDVGMVHPRRSMDGILKECKYWADTYGPNSKSLYMFGDAGLGKTHLALSIASVVLEKGYDVIYVSSQSVFSTIGNFDEKDKAEELFSAMMTADLLVLDDLGTEYTTPYILAKLYELVNARIGKPTIYTTNICNNRVLEMRYDEKIISRLLGECHPMRFWGEDIRLQDK